MLKRIMIVLAAVVLFPWPEQLDAKAGSSGASSSGVSSSAKCANCRKPVDKAAKVKNKVAKEVFLCPECARLPRCNFCGMPAVVTSPGGDPLCRDCSADTIRDKAEAEKVMNDVRKVLAAKFKMTTKHKITFEIGSRKDLNNEADGEHLELGWFDPKTLRDKPHYTIRILTGLPRDVFRSVGAHELAHDWMNETLPHISDKDQISEGFAEYVAWLFSKAEGNRRMMEYTERRTDDVYGAGFRKVREMMGGAKTAAEWKAILLKEFPLKGTKKKDK